MAEQEPAVVRGYMAKQPDGELYPMAAGRKKRTVERGIPGIDWRKRGWTIVPVKIEELPVEQEE